MIYKMKPGEMMLDIWKYILEYYLCAASFQNFAEEMFITFLGDNASPIVIALT